MHPHPNAGHVAAKLLDLRGVFEIDVRIAEVRKKHLRCDHEARVYAAPELGKLVDARSQFAQGAARLRSCVCPAAPRIDFQRGVTRDFDVANLRVGAVGRAGVDAHDFSDLYDSRPRRHDRDARIAPHVAVMHAWKRDPQFRCSPHSAELLWESAAKLMACANY